MGLRLTFRELHAYRRTFFVIFTFCMVASFSFFATRGMKQSSAASTAGFSAGNIMSDAMMANYNSMSKDDIQRFLTAKNPCSWRDYSEYQRLEATYPKLDWYFRDGHFVCLSEERFGDGEVVGTGQTAAEIIYQAAQDYHINPQVLIVLLEKEQGLITDVYPNNYQYRAATGFGCPDTAVCSEKYYGFKNQVRNAAAMFRSVLDGGWSNYPAGKTAFIQYNPSASCGGTNVYIENRATSALYRYTPYQPNASVLNAGYGTGDACGAYGNRNFYLYFTDWFGSTQRDLWVALDTPRYFEVTQDFSRIDPFTEQNADANPLTKGTIIFFTSKVMYNEEQCFRTEHNTTYKINACVPQRYLKEITLNYQDLTTDEQYKIINAGGKKITIDTKQTQQFNMPLIRKFLKKAEFLGETYYFTEFDVKNSAMPMNGFKSEELTHLEEYIQLSSNLTVSSASAQKVDLKTGTIIAGMPLGTIRRYTASMKIEGKTYYQTEFEYNNNNAGYLVDGASLVGYEPFAAPKYLRLTQTVNRINPVTNEFYDTLGAGRIIEFSEQISINGQLYYRTKHNATYGLYYAIPATATEEVR